MRYGQVEQLLKFMDIHDIIYKTYSSGEKPDPYCFCHYGWEGIGSFAFWRFACAYYDSADALYEKFVSSKGNFAITDGQRHLNNIYLLRPFL